MRGTGTTAGLPLRPAHLAPGPAGRPTAQLPAPTRRPDLSPTEPTHLSPPIAVRAAPSLRPTVAIYAATRLGPAIAVRASCFRSAIAVHASWHAHFWPAIAVCTAP